LTTFLAIHYQKKKNFPCNMAQNEGGDGGGGNNAGGGGAGGGDGNKKSQSKDVKQEQQPVAHPAKEQLPGVQYCIIVLHLGVSIFILLFLNPYYNIIS
jgi:hypothetical protein